MSLIVPELVEIDYTNHEGKRKLYVIWPKRIVFKSTMWHPEPQWILEAADVRRGVNRGFAMKDIHRCTPWKDGSEGLAGAPDQG